MPTCIKEGSVLHHGTSADFDERTTELEGPAWFSSSPSVARVFALRRSGADGSPRILRYRVTQDVELPEILSAADLEELAEEHNLSVYGPEEIRESIRMSGLPGWIIPYNYPDGDDILLVDTSILEFIDSETLPRS